MTEQKRADIATYWKETAKDKNALQRTCELFDVTEDEVKEVIQKKRKTPFWNEEKVTRLKAYLAQGMKNAEISNRLGCDTQVIAVYKRNHKDELAQYIPEKKEKTRNCANSNESKVKECKPTTESIPEEDYTTEEPECQEESAEMVCAEEYKKLYLSYQEAHEASRHRFKNLVDVSVLLTAADYIGKHVPDDKTAEREYELCCKTIISAALELVNRSIFTAERAVSFFRRNGVKLYVEQISS